MNRARTRTSANRGFTLSAMIILLSLVMPALARERGESGVTRSLANLQAINAALASYAADVDGRQPTAVVDDFSTYGANGPEAVTNYFSVNGVPHPPLLLGECDGHVGVLPAARWASRRTATAHAMWMWMI